MRGTDITYTNSALVLISELRHLPADHLFCVLPKSDSAWWYRQFQIGISSSHFKLINFSIEVRLVHPS